MQDGVLNLSRVKLRDQQRLAHGPLTEYPVNTDVDETPRAGNASGGGQPGWAVRTKGGGPNDFIYVIIQPPGWAHYMELCGRPELVEDPEWATPAARLPKLDECFKIIEEWTLTKTKREAMDILNDRDIPCGPILSMKEIAEEPALRDTGTVVEVDHPTRGKYLTVGMPVKLSDSQADVQPSPLLGEHTEEILKDILGLGEEELQAVWKSGALGKPLAKAAE